MKKIVEKLRLNNKVKLIMYIVVASVLLSSCDRKRTPIENFKGGIIYDKHRYLSGEFSFDIKKDSSFFKVFVYKLDHERYKLGDTIK